MPDLPVNLTIDTSIADAISEGLLSPTDMQLESLEIGSAVDPSSCGEIWDASDAATWTPGMWWLLNWWTWEYPAPWVNVQVMTPQGPSIIEHTGPAIYTIELCTSPQETIPPLGPSLSALGDRDGAEPPPPLPLVREIVEQMIVRGNGIVDLLA
tara:strand:- start:135 stop:596 length:462 start_codon:yes stop_codon:yes gene_type:complete